MSHELYKRYRPPTFKAFIGATPSLQSLKKKVLQGKTPHTILISGPSGTGKTTIGRILKKKLNCGDMDFKEVNCADFRGIDTVRDIKQVISLKAFSGCRMWLIDEAHQLTKDAQNAFLKILEDTPDHCYFVLCTTEPEKLLKTILNRCTRVYTQALKETELMDLLVDICVGEKIKISKEVLDRIVANSEGSARQALVTLEQVLALETEEEQLKAIVSQGAKKVAFDIVKGLLWERPDWPKLAGVIKEVEEDAESIRKLIMAISETEILKANKNSNRAFKILCIFEDPIYDSGRSARARLTRMIYEASIAKG